LQTNELWNEVKCWTYRSRHFLERKLFPLQWKLSNVPPTQLHRNVNFHYPYAQAKEPLMKWKARYSWPPCTDQFWSAAFGIAIIIELFYKTSYLEEEVNCTEPSLSDRVPCSSQLKLFESPNKMPIESHFKVFYSSI